MNDEETSHIDHAELERFAIDVLERVGVVRSRSEQLARIIVSANLHGIDTHGISKLPLYVDNLERGGFKPDPEVDIRRTVTETVRHIDADDGPGHFAACDGMAEVIDGAKENGACFGVITNSNHVGMLAYYTLMAAEDGCIGLFMTNTVSLVAPFGGIDPFFGTNPMAVSIPTPRSYHLTLDMATSQTAMNKVAMAERNDESIPEGWAINSDGESTTDPSAVHSLLPMGDHKGYGLAIVVDVFAGVLSGMGPSPSANPLSDPSAPQKTGQFLGALHVDTFMDSDMLAACLDEMISHLKAARTRPGVDEVMLPGEIEANARDDRMANGIPLAPSTREQLAELAHRFEVPPPES